MGDIQVLWEKDGRTLSKRIARWEDIYKKNRKTIKSSRKLADYAQHDVGCKAYQSPQYISGRCSCGLEELLNA